MFNFTYWCKWIISYFYVRVFKRSMKKRFDELDVDSDRDPYKIDFLPFPEESTLESALPESQLISTADEIFFYGVNSKSEYFFTRIARGTNQEAEAWIYLQLSNGKVYHLQETSGFQQSTSDNRAFTCGGLQIHYLSPMRRWRIFFNGLLKEISEDGTPSVKNAHVRFELLWRASTDLFDVKTDLNTKILPTSLAKIKWNQYAPPLEKLSTALNFYAQCGMIIGTVAIDGTEDEMELHMFGERIRFLSDISSMEGMEFSHFLGHVLKNGRFVHVTEVSIPNVTEKFVFGFATALTGGIRSIQDKECSLIKVDDEEDGDASIEAKFEAGGKKFRLKGTINGKQSKFDCSKCWNGWLAINCLDFEINSLTDKQLKLLKEKEPNLVTGEQLGRGIFIKGKIMKSTRKILQEKPSNPIPLVTPLVAHFSEKICQDPEVSGGKGSSLGKLTEIGLQNLEFIVPKGLVVTTRAYKIFLTDEILEGIKKLENVLYQNNVDETKAECQRLMDRIINTLLPDPIQQAVVNNLRIAFPHQTNDLKFAIRSSATGEDTEQMSAAGQMETYLGVAGTTEIISAIKKCWASQFSYIAVQYKRQNGQIINSPMAVVVQEMVPCDIAGVLFTCNPLTGNPTTMTITANYGLGESVVSGSEEPDTIEIERIDKTNLTVKTKIIGAKNHRIVLKEDGGISVEDVADNQKVSCCLSDNMVLRLGHIAINIEKVYRSHRDIEWGIWKNNLYIFQSRPVTSGTGENDFEIDHEFDTHLRCESDYLSVYNVGEVMPGATSPLGLDIILKFIKTAVESKNYVLFQQGERPRYHSRSFGAMYRHVMIYFVDMLQHINSDPSKAPLAGLSVFGKILDDEELFEMAKERYGDYVQPSNKLLFPKLFYRIFYGSQSMLKQAIKKYEEYVVPSVKYNNSQELFDHLLSCCSDLRMPFGCHMVCTEVCSVVNIIIFLTLQEAYGEINADLYTDFSQLLTVSSGVESAEVPIAMETLAYFIFKETNSDEFKSKKTEEALRWLEASKTTAGEKYREFLQKHGHRCLREFDIHSVTWKTDPHSLVKLLQNLVGSVTKERVDKEPEEDFQKTISSLKAPLNWRTKFTLKMTLSICRKSIQNRECSKGFVMQVLNEWRNGYRKLAQLMMQEGRIPDEDLLFFMNLEEIKELLETRSPRIISKANHRRRRQPIVDKLFFPGLMKGFPKPVNAAKKITVNTDHNFSLKGIPVSQGVATGTVRVAFDLEEASLLQPGEILVTYSTDIGWSPYFPILGGVVTEIGGLVSHGAVVSREYGLPCIAGVNDATQHFKTGDYVLLDGNKGILQRLPKPEDSLVSNI